MIESFPCPVCRGERWRDIGQRRYELADVEHLSVYAKPRYRVLFEIWCPGERSMTLTSRVCEECGFVAYAPRPTPAEVEAKYRFLGQIGTPGLRYGPDAPIEARRARQLYRHAARHQRGRRRLRVLDYGGGDGRLMRDFLAAGHDCSLIDYIERAIPGVVRLGATEAALPPQSRFDLIIACHVIEHVAEPLAVVRTLARHLAPGGQLYVEVPLEVWRRAPLHEEPVTHVNFFTPASCRRLFAEAGLATLSIRPGGYLQETGRTLPAVRIVATAGQPAAVAVGLGLAETLSLLSPGAWLRLKRYAWMPARIPGALLSRFRRR